MNQSRWIGLFAIALLAALTITPGFAQGERGKAELKAGSGSITVDYGRPALKARDPFTWQKEGTFWRMGANQSTTFTTPVDLMFGDTKIAAGSYSLWLKRVAADQYELTFNSQTGQWGTQHDASKDVASAAMKKSTLASPAEIFTIELQPAANGGVIALQWGTGELAAAFTMK